MRILIRYFFRGVRVLLAPVMLISEKLSTPKAVERTPEEQAQVDAACQQLALYQFRTCPFCIKVRKEIARLGLNIELRDAQLDPAHKQALLEGGGKVRMRLTAGFTSVLARNYGDIRCLKLDLLRGNIEVHAERHALRSAGG